MRKGGSLFLGAWPPGWFRNADSGRLLRGALLYIGIALAAVLVIRFIVRLSNFGDNLKYINLEIGRTTGREKKHWLRRRRRLWWSLFIPFV